ncbi:MAG: hypothetical protein V1897_20045 [Pseudomonadota bacterium]
MLVLAVFLVLTLNSASHGQSAKQISHSSQKAQSETNPDTVALVGPYGHKVVIPEIKINQISGKSKPKPAVEAPPESTRLESVSDESDRKKAPKEPSIPSELPKAEGPSEYRPRSPLDHIPYRIVIPFGKEDLLKGFLIAAILILTTGNALVSGNSWVVIKDKKGVYRVIKAGKTTPSTIAGPFKSKEAAKRAKEKELRKASPLRSWPKRDCIQLRLPGLNLRRPGDDDVSATGRSAKNNLTAFKRPSSRINAPEKKEHGHRGTSVSKLMEAKQSGEVAKRM